MNNVKELLYNYYERKFINVDRYIYYLDNCEILSSDTLINDFLEFYLCDRVEKDFINKIESDLFYKVENEKDIKELYKMFDGYILDITSKNSNCIILVKEN